MLVAERLMLAAISLAGRQEELPDEHRGGERVLGGGVVGAALNERADLWVSKQHGLGRRTSCR